MEELGLVILEWLSVSYLTKPFQKPDVNENTVGDCHKMKNCTELTNLAVNPTAQRQTLNPKLVVLFLNPLSLYNPLTTIHIYIYIAIII